MKLNKKIALLLLLVLTSCQSKTIDNGYLDKENVQMIEDINNLANDTFKKGKELIKNINLINKSKPEYKSDRKEDLIKNLEIPAKTDPKAKWIYDNYNKLPNIQAYLVGNDTDTVEFVYNLNNNINEFEYKEGESIKLNRSTPYYLQRDNRWAYDQLSDSNIGIAGCGPTSISMVLSRLTNDPSITPKLIGKDAQEFMVEEGIAWSFFEHEANEYGFKCEDIPNDKDKIIEALKDGPLIVSVQRGYFTLSGHILVIDSYKDGKFIINDPNSVKNTMREWEYEQLKDQIVHIWKIS